MKTSKILVFLMSLIVTSLSGYADNCKDYGQMDNDFIRASLANGSLGSCKAYSKMGSGNGGGTNDYTCWLQTPTNYVLRTWGDRSCDSLMDSIRAASINGELKNSCGECTAISADADLRAKLVAGVGACVAHSDNGRYLNKGYHCFVQTPENIVFESFGDVSCGELFTKVKEAVKNGAFKRACGANP